MENIQAVTLHGSSVQIEPGTLETLKASLRGQVLMPENEEYEQSRKVWNGMIDRRPAFIIKCSCPSDVISAVRFAREWNLLVSVKCGGHNYGGISVCNKGLMIDLSAMRGIRVNLVNLTVRAEGGVLLGDLDKETQAFGLATTSGTISHTGIGGLTLGGGQGWLMSKYGLTCDNLLSVDIVTADGQLLTANKEQHADLFWAVRGGGGNFGIVTSFEYKLHSVGPNILGGLIVYPIDQAREVLQFFRDFSMRPPDELTVLGGLLCLPDGVPAIAVGTCWTGDPEEGKAALQPLRDFGSPLADMTGEMPYLALQSIFNPSVPHGMYRYAKMGYAPALSDDFIDVILKHIHQRTSPASVVIFQAIKGAVTRIDPEETAFFHRHQQWHFDIISQWTDPGTEQKHMDWVRSFWNDAVAFTSGASINFFGSDDGQDRVRLSFGTNYDRLAELKAKYDPDNMFRMNSNILPKAKERKETLI